MPRRLMYLKGTWSLVGVAIWEEFGALGGMEEALRIGRPFQFFLCFLLVDLSFLLPPLPL